MLTHRHGFLVRTCALLVACLHLLFSCACTGWKYVPNRGAVDYEETMLDQSVRFTQKTTTQEIIVKKVNYPIISGPPVENPDGEMIDVDLRWVTAFEVLHDGTPGDAVQVTNYDETLLRKRVRFHAPDRVWDLQVKEIAYPMVRGPYSETPKGPPQQVDLRNITGFEVYSLNGVATFFAVVGIIAAVVLVVAIIAAATEDNSRPPASSSGESCPVLYVYDDSGAHRIGEAYAGAVFRSVQRDDLLPVPSTPGSVLHCLFLNEAPETQYTDKLELVVVDHPRGTRAVATAAQEPLLVGALHELRVARDASGADVTAAVRSDDDTVWQTDWDAVMAATDPALRDEISATFDAPSNDDQPVLELVLSNTYWLEYTVGRFFGLTGINFDDHMAQWNDPSNGPFVKSWLEREGVSLTIEQKRGEIWEPVAVVPPVGAMELRRVAIPLCAVPSASGTLDVRVSGGTGFWQIDEMALSLRSRAKANVRHVAPSVMTDEDDVDQRANVAAVDGNYQVLADLGERIPFDFELPHLNRGRQRSLFLFTNGYYNAHRPEPVSREPSKVTPVASREGGLAALGIDGYRHFHELSINIPRSEDVVTPVEP